jgi:hypothetical protein
MKDHLKTAVNLSLIARAAVALHAFEGYCRHFHFEHHELADFTDHLWQFMVVNEPELFRQWGNKMPALASAAVGQDYPDGFPTLLSDHAIDADEFRELLTDTYDMIDGSLYAATDNEGTIKNLTRILAIARTHNIPLPDLTRFQKSLWEHNGGWGWPLSPQELLEWRASC